MLGFIESIEKRRRDGRRGVQRYRQVAGFSWQCLFGVDRGATQLVWEERGDEKRENQGKVRGSHGCVSLFEKQMMTYVFLVVLCCIMFSELSTSRNFLKALGVWKKYWIKIDLFAEQSNLSLDFFADQLRWWVQMSVAVHIGQLPQPIKQKGSNLFRIN